VVGAVFFGIVKARILVVEDEPSILDTVVYALETEGLSAVGCATCEAARRAVADAVFDLAILDVGLPDGNGMELCRLLREKSALPVIFLTARSSEVDRIVGLEIGGDDYVVKPFSPRELTARVKAVLRRVHSLAPQVDLRQVRPANALCIDEQTCQATFFGEALGLSATELRLLQTLSKHPGRVFSREQLMNLAWDDPGSAMERTVDAHVKALRQKLRAVREDVEPIQTHRGFGYSYRLDWQVA
jgi:two-component system, OmpR family, catabolic regulation response regulator CreB